VRAFAQFGADLHENDAEMILALALVDAPDLVVPGVAFLEVGVAGVEELLGEVGVEAGAVSAGESGD
jgi:hypothetical protein